MPMQQKYEYATKIGHVMVTSSGHVFLLYVGYHIIKPQKNPNFLKHCKKTEQVTVIVYDKFLTTSRY